MPQAMEGRILYDSHMHTPLCKHAEGEPEAYAQVALERGLAGIIMTCHNPLPGRVSHQVRMLPEQWSDYTAMVERARVAYAGRVDVRLGIEADYIPGFEPFLEDQLRDESLHHVLGSVHPFVHDHWDAYSSDPVTFQRRYFELLAIAAETGLFDTISHPDLVKNFTAGDWDVGRIMGDIDSALDRIADTGVAMELNTSGVNKTVPEMNPFPRMLKAMCERGIPVVLGSDSHVPHRVADNFVGAMDLLERVGYRSVRYFLDRRPNDVAIDAARASLLEHEAV